jgi:CubicO group peptidase (beta-lactamase class C family)
VFVVNEQEEILLLAHPKRGGSWEVVNGALEAREPVAEGALRETYEEAGEEVCVRPLGAGHVSTFHYDDNVQYMLSVGYLMAYVVELPNISEGLGGQAQLARPAHVSRASAVAIRLGIVLGLVAALAACGSSATATRTVHAVPSPVPIASPSTATSSDRASKIDGYLATLTARGRFSGAVLVSTNDDVLFSHGYGMADADSSVPNTPHTRFLIGSMDKQFAAAAVLLLQSRGKLNVADRACDHIPACPAAWRSITIHQLLTHTAGLRDLPPDIAILTGGEDKPLARTDLIKLLQNDPLLSTPGDRFSYSTLGYIVLEEIVERESGENYDAFQEHSIFGPLGMLDTAYACDPESLAMGQSAPGVRARLVNWPSVYTMCSSAEDLYRWDRALYTEQLLPSSELQAMFTPYVAAPVFGDVEYGYGWFVGEVRGHRVVGHAGWIPGSGFRSFIQRYTDDHVAVIVLCNLESCDVSMISSTIADVVFNE